MSEDVKVREGFVTDRRREKVTVRVFNDLDCDSCEGSCGGGDNSFEVTATDPVGVDEGDRVEVEIEPRSFGKIASVVFGIPAVALVGGLGIGTLLSRGLFGGGDGFPLQMGTAGLLFLASLLGLVAYDRWLADRSSERAVVTDLVERDCRGVAASVSGSV